MVDHQTRCMAALIVLQHGDGRKLWLLNSACLTLLPKKVDVVEVKGYHSISLIHSFAKLVTKIMVNCLASHLPSPVSSNQGVFVHSRCILDNFLLVQ